MTESDTASQAWGSAGETPPIETALRQLHADRFTGRLIVFSTAGAEIHLRDGLVTALDTPAAPGPESLLLKSGRVAQTDWATAVDAAGDSGRLGEILTSRELVGAGELDVVRTAAVYDAAFALSLGTLGRWQTHPSLPGSEPVLPLRPGVSPELLLTESFRRFALLRLQAGSPSRLARSRPATTTLAARVGTAVIQRHREILLCANGRRTPRDIAFFLGRGVYAVMIDIIRMASQGLLETEERIVPDTLPSVAPRKPADAAAPGTEAGAGPAPELPQRTAQAAPRPEGMTPHAKSERAPANGGLLHRLRGRRDTDAAAEPPEFPTDTREAW